MSCDPCRIRTVPRAIAAGTLLATGAGAVASPQVVVSVETPHCDVLPNLVNVEELGSPNVFPIGEHISAVATFTMLSACPMSDIPAIPNRLVRIGNLNSIAFTDVFYVADPIHPTGVGGTTVSNEDGIVNAGQAFRIDTIGMNQPLVLESQIADGIFSPGEFWDFIIDDYQNGSSIAPDQFNTIGVGSAAPGPPSSGSIIALIPEPGSLAWCSVAGVWLIRRRRY